MKCPNCERESNGRFCVNCGCVMPPVTNLEVSVGADDISTSNNGNTREAVVSNVVKASFSGAETRYEVKGYEKKSRSSLALGIVGLSFSVVFPIVTLPCSTVGVIVAVKHLINGKKAVAGLALNVTALVVGVFTLAVEVSIGYMYLFM